MFQKKYIILNGARQVGKTTLLQLIEKELRGAGVPDEKIFYLNLEDVQILDDLNQSPENLRKYILNSEGVNYFLIDEIQYLNKASNFLKHIYDKYAPEIKIITTGSSSLEFKAQLQDSLAGRKISFNVTSLDFEEFLSFRQFEFIKYLRKTEIPAEIKRRFDEMLEEYLLYGGMPAVVLQPDTERKVQMLKEYVGTYINKDVRAIGKVQNISQFNAFIKVVASQIGNLLNIAELANTVNIPRRKVEQYMDILEHTFVVARIRPFHRNTRTQLTKMPKIYFLDVGVRNAIMHNFLEAENRSDAGELFENFVFLELLSATSLENIFFYRTVRQAEIDFVLQGSPGVSLIEVKYKQLRKSIDTRVLREFAEREKSVDNIAVVNRTLEEIDKGVTYQDYRAVAHIIDK